MTAQPKVLWQPSNERLKQAKLTGYTNWLKETRGVSFDRYDDLWSWSAETHPEDFWKSVVDYFELPYADTVGEVMSSDAMPYTRWFKGVTTNFAEQVFRFAHLDSPALVYESEALGKGELSWSELKQQVASLAECLRSQGVQPGDRVVACLPNTWHAVVSFLAVAAVGAIWSICAPEMGPVSILDRFQQIEPKAFIACDGYVFSGKTIDKRPVIEEVASSLPTLKTIIRVNLISSDRADIAGKETISWQQASSQKPQLRCESVSFEQPLWVVYSSGTTGIPKAIVHGHGGVALMNIVSAAFHTDLGPGDRYLWVASTGWIVWNILVCGLLVGATVCLFDGALTGSGSTPDWQRLWRFVAENNVEAFGAGAGFFASCDKFNVEPGRDCDLSTLRTIISSGAPLTPESYEWIYRQVPDVWVTSASGGTDIAGAFITGAPTLPVYSGEMQCRGLGAAVYAFDDDGRPVEGRVGELVCTRALPSMPLYFWGDKDDERYLDSYFGMYTDAKSGQSVWRHGDWLELNSRSQASSGVIFGRSDATINRGGIRMGTSEIYRVVDRLPVVADSMVVDLEYLGKPSMLALFVVLRNESELTTEIEDTIRSEIRVSLSPRYVPNKILAVPGIPRNITGKKLELPIKKVLLGFNPEYVAKRDGLANPDIFDWYVDNAQEFI